MSTKQLTTKRQKAPAGSPAGPAPSLLAGAGRALGVSATFPLMRLSLSVEPFISIVNRHVKISEKARQEIMRDLTEMLGRADVQILTSINALSGDSDTDEILTTEQAAQVVGVSRPFMVKLIDAGAVELHQKVGNQRRVLRSAVLRWKAAERSRQAAALKRLGEDLDEEIFSS